MEVFASCCCGDYLGFLFWSNSSVYHYFQQDDIDCHCCTKNYLIALEIGTGSKTFWLATTFLLNLYLLRKVLSNCQNAEWLVTTATFLGNPGHPEQGKS